jgi:ribosomal protein S1
MPVNVNDDLDRAFGNYLQPERAADWELVKAGPHRGSRVSGRVVARYLFGIFLDIGAGFPALLSITQFNPRPKRRPVVLEDYPAVDSMVIARVVGFNDRNRQIGLTQLDPDPALDTEKPS